jgi:hypothetical protein
MSLISSDTLLGLFGGFGLSYFLWWYLNHRLVPKIEFSEELSRRPIDYDKQAVRHQFAFKNIGKRSIVNIRLKARIRINDPRKRGVNIFNYFDIAINDNNGEIFEMKPGVMLRISVDVHKSKNLDNPLLDNFLLQKLKTEDITLDDIFFIYPDSVFFVQIIGTDIYSNATKVFVSKMYAKDDVRSGVFKGKELSIAAYFSTTEPWECKKLSNLQK